MKYERGTFTTVVTKSMEGLTPHAQALYFWLCAYANSETQECYPSIATLSAKSNMGERTVREKMDELISKGLVEKETRRDSFGRPTSNLYHVNLLQGKVRQLPHGGAPAAGGVGAPAADKLNGSFETNENEPNLSAPPDTETSENESSQFLERDLSSEPPPAPPPPPKREIFTPPTGDELTDYFHEKGSTREEARKFFFFYSSKGWMVGKNKMKSWQAAASGWIARNAQPQSEYFAK